MRKLLLLFLLATIAACGPAKEPDIGKGLPPNYIVGERLFDERVKRQFPIGTSEKSLVAELERQGFSKLQTYEGVHDATFKQREFPTETIWSVRWRATDGRVVEIWGVYGVRAP
jgi:hypothetical protein